MGSVFPRETGRGPGDPGDKALSGARHILETVRRGSCDLHLHTRFSDGADSVPALVQNVLAAGLNCFSVTDHDSVDAIPEVISLLDMLRSLGFVCPEFIPGIELSVDYGTEIHILGYFPYGGYEKMAGFIEAQKASRRKRNLELCECLTAMGMPVSIEELNAEGGSNVGRLHAAKILMRKGYVGSVGEAFDNLFGDGRPCHVSRSRPGIEEALLCIREAGGVPVLAHPYLYQWTGSPAIVSGKLLRSLRELKDCGLMGVEAFHGESDRAQQDETLAAAVTLGLIVTAGSDWHGANKPGLMMYGGGSAFLWEMTDIGAAAVIEADGRILAVCGSGGGDAFECALPCVQADGDDTDLPGQIAAFAAQSISPDLVPDGHYATAYTHGEDGRHILAAWRFTAPGGRRPALKGCGPESGGTWRFLSFQELAARRMPAAHAAIVSSLREIPLFSV